MSMKVDYRYLTAAERLWQIIDNIDSLSDMVKPTDIRGFAAFYNGVMARVGERHKLLVSDGYTLQLPKENNLQIIGIEKNPSTCGSREGTCEA